jgi:hypothetical protein
MPVSGNPPPGGTDKATRDHGLFMTDNHSHFTIIFLSYSMGIPQEYEVYLK